MLTNKGRTMRKNPTKRIEQFRVTSGKLASDRSDGANGAFTIVLGDAMILVIASDARDWGDLPGKPWEHVSVSLMYRCPTWNEMDAVKRIFWRDDETVLQLHVPREQHLSYCDTCLHLWKPIGVAIPLPPPETVAPEGS